MFAAVDYSKMHTRARNTLRVTAGLIRRWAQFYTPAVLCFATPIICTVEARFEKKNGEAFTEGPVL